MQIHTSNASVELFR